MDTTSLMHRAKRGRDYPIRLSLSVSSNLMELRLIPYLTILIRKYIEGILKPCRDI